MDATGLGSVVVGLVLCFFGARSLHIAVLASGFAIGWLLADAFAAPPLTSLVFAVVAGVAAWLLARLVFGLAAFVVGAFAGAVVGAKLFALLEHDGGSVVLAVLFVAAAGFIGGVAARRFGGGVLIIACALAGAGLTVSGLARMFPQALGFLRAPDSPAAAALAAVIWIALAAIGWGVQRRSAMSKNRSPRTN